MTKTTLLLLFLLPAKGFAQTIDSLRSAVAGQVVALADI